MYLGQDNIERVQEAAQAARGELIQQAGEFPVKVAGGALAWFFLIYWFLIRGK